MPDEACWNRFFDADCVLSKLDCHDLSGDVVEFGCGYGLFTVLAAQRTRGQLYALDIDADMIQVTKQKVEENGLRNVVVERRDFLAEGSGRPDASVAYSPVFNILHVDNPLDFLREVYRATAIGGKIGIIHWNYDPSTPRGPSTEIRPRPEQCCAWAEDAGFRLLRQESLACCPYHYGIIAQRATQKSSGDKVERPI